MLSAALLLGGCAAEVVGDGTVELGTGEWRFEPVVDGQDVTLVRGVQGGFHVWVSMHADGLEREGVTMELVTAKMDGTRDPEMSVVDVDLAPATEGAGTELLGWPAILADPGCVVDSALLVRVTLTDRRGAQASDELVVIPRGTDMPPCSE
jgi:hypothetical protein